MAEPTIHRRRWLRFSIRTMLVVVTLLCVWLTLVIVPGQRQQRTVARIHGMNESSRALYDYEFSGAPGPRGPEWLRRWLGDAYFQQIARAEILLDGQDDVALEELTNLPGLEQLTIQSTPLANDGLHALARLRKLEYLSIYSDDLSDQGLEQLAGATALRQLNIESNLITGVGFRTLAALPRLRYLSINSDGITPDGLKAVARLGKVESLYLGSDSLSDECLKALSAMHGLRELRIHNGHDSSLAPHGLTDESCKHLARLSNLRLLVVRSPTITDEGLAHLAALSKLAELDVRIDQPNYTAEGVARLQTQLPGLKVDYNDPPKDRR